MMLKVIWGLGDVFLELIIIVIIDEFIYGEEVVIL